MNKHELFEKIGHICMMRREESHVSIRQWSKRSRTTHQSLAAFERGETNSLFSFLSYLSLLNISDLYQIRRMVGEYRNDSK